MSRVAGGARTAAVGGIVWIASVLVTEQTLHLYNVLMEPQATRGDQYGISLFAFMGIGWGIGWLPAWWVIKRLQRSPAFARRAVFITGGYLLAVSTVMLAAEYWQLGRRPNLEEGLLLSLAVLPSVMALPFALLSPLSVLLGLLALLPLFGLLWVAFARFSKGARA